MKRAARFVALAGVFAGLFFPICGCRGSSGISQNETQQPQKPQIAIELATATNVVAMYDAGREDATVVVVARNNDVFLGIDRMDISNLSQRVRDMLANKVDREVYIRADARARFRTVEDVIDSLRAVNVEYVELLVRRKNADAQQNYDEFLKNLTGMDLVVWSPSVMKKNLPKGIPVSMDRVTILRGPAGTPAYKINQVDVQKAELLPKLTGMYKNRGERILFIRADDDLDFASVVEVIDIARGADVDHIAVLTPQMIAGH